MKCIFAQGNPDSQYAQTRHNIGFMCLDAFTSLSGTTFASKAKFHAEVAEISFAGEKVLLVKPTTFYNETGRSLRAIKDFYKLSNNDILVLHDDLALDFGTIRIRHRGSDAGNNGIKSLNSHLGENYARLRIGISNQQRSVMPDVDFVLGKFSQQEQTAINKHLVPCVNGLVETFLASGLEDSSVHF